MSNTYFQFKQLIIHQDQCAMKVSTDSCLFGAWLTKTIIPTLPDINQVLDIGAGSGLLMLMLAQEYDFFIEGIEIDSSAFQQAFSNITRSDWKDRLNVCQGDVRQHTFKDKYDLIISNPPFYEMDLRPTVASKAAAMHDTTLRFEELLAVIELNLKPDGYFALLIPFHRFDYLKELFISKGFFLHKVVHVQHREDHAFIRSMVLLSKKPAETSIESMTIKEKDGSYTSDFKQLLREYYLYL